MIHTRLKISLWNDICQQPTLTVTRAHYVKRASDSTTQLQQCIQNVLTVLDDRAIVLTVSADFATALRDATAMQEISPLSPLGYLRAATIYGEQGRQRAAMHICNVGLSVVDVSDPGYSKLQEAKTVAMQRDTYRIDFISKLPVEIVTDVLFPMLLGDGGTLDGKNPCPFLDVSKTWFERVLQTGGGGLHFKIVDQSSYIEVVRRAQHTKTIQIESSSQGLWISYFFQRANFCNLQEIKIKGLKGYTALDDLVSSFKSISNTLTHLTIWKPTRGSFQPAHPLRVADILINCPQLVMLDIDYRFDTDFSAVTWTTTWPQLTALSLNCRNSAISNDELLQIMKRLPSLKNLMLNARIETQAMTMIKHYCPSMRDLQLKTNRIGPSSSLAVVLSSPIRHAQQHEAQRMREGHGGLEKLSFSEASQDGVSWMHMRNMLQQHHNSLVHLQLDLDYAGNNDQDLFNLEFPCLKTLALQCRGSNNACFGWWIMGKAPFLEELSITTWAIESYPGLGDFTPPRTLRRLAMDLHATTNRRVEPMMIERYLNQFAQQEETSLLKELEIRYNENGDIPATHAVAISSLKNLQHLAISCSHLWKLSELDHFTKMIADGCPHLTSLGLDIPTQPSAHTVNLLKRLQHLRHLAFHLAGFGEYGDFWYAFRTFSQLKSIRILSVTDVVNRKFVSYLKSLRPDIKIVT